MEFLSIWLNLLILPQQVYGEYAVVDLIIMLCHFVAFWQAECLLLDILFCIFWARHNSLNSVLRNTMFNQFLFWLQNKCSIWNLKSFSSSPCCWHEICISFCSFLIEEWKFLRQGESKSQCLIADKIWRKLSRRIDEKIIEVLPYFFGFQ